MIVKGKKKSFKLVSLILTIPKIRLCDHQDSYVVMRIYSAKGYFRKEKAYLHSLVCSFTKDIGPGLESEM